MRHDANTYGERQVSEEQAPNRFEEKAQDTRWHYPPGGVPQRVTPMTNEEWAREIVGDSLIKPDVDCDNIDLTSMVSAIATALEAAYQEGRKDGSTRTRSRSKHWEKILKFIGDQGDVSVQDIQSAYPFLSIGAVRSMCSLYVKRGLIERVAQGIYRLKEPTDV